jgi:hypothetical protein
MPANEEKRFQTIHPEPGKSGPRISKAKYDAVRKAILRAVPKRADGIPFQELPERVRELLPRKALDDLGSVPWYTVTVKLDLEARREIERVPRSRPQRIRRCQ